MYTITEVRRLFHMVVSFGVGLPMAYAGAALIKLAAFLCFHEWKTVKVGDEEIW